MGMFDRVKEAKQQAKDALAGVGTIPGGAPAGVSPGMMAGLPTNMNEQLRHSDLVQKLKASGVEAPAVINAIRRGATEPLSGSVSTELDISIKPANGAPYETTFKQSMLPAWLDTLAPHSTVHEDHSIRRLLRRRHLLPDHGPVRVGRWVRLPHHGQRTSRREDPRRDQGSG
jgi:hypothetical protein